MFGVETIPTNLMPDFTKFKTRLLEKRKRRPNTVRAYDQFLRMLPEIRLVEMSEDEILGTINMLIDKIDRPTSKMIAMACYRNYIRFLFDETKTVIEDPVRYEQLRNKKNNTLANIEEGEDRVERRLDLEKFYARNGTILKAWRIWNDPITGSCSECTTTC